MIRRILKFLDFPMRVSPDQKNFGEGFCSSPSCYQGKVKSTPSFGKAYSLTTVLIMVDFVIRMIINIIDI